MSRMLVLIIISFYGSVFALEPGEIDAASTLTQSSMVFETLSLSLLKLPTNEQGEHIFSFCLSKDGHWGVVPFGKAEGYRVDQVSQQVEIFSCYTAISNEQVMALSDYISHTKDKESPWVTKRYRPCYPKKVGNNTINICHEISGCRDCKIHMSFTRAELYENGFWLVTTAFILVWGSVYVGLKYMQCVYICPKCNHQWSSNKEEL